jgi:hypothetical protein
LNHYKLVPRQSFLNGFERFGKFVYGFYGVKTGFFVNRKPNATLAIDSYYVIGVFVDDFNFCNVLEEYRNPVVDRACVVDVVADASLLACL